MVEAPGGSGSQARRGLYDTDRYATSYSNIVVCV